jgi:hypothetical protein
MGIPVRALIREKGTPYKELGLDDPKWTDEQLIDHVRAHPILINRPIVVTPKGVPPLGSGARPPAQSPHRTLRQGGRRSDRHRLAARQVGIQVRIGGYPPSVRSSAFVNRPTDITPRPANAIAPRTSTAGLRASELTGTLIAIRIPMRPK